MRVVNQKVLDFVQLQRVGVLAVEMLDGSPHAATVHFANSQQPLLFYFETNKAYRKAEPLLKNGKTRASLVVGFNEADMRTLQLDGEVRLVPDSEMDVYNAVYLGKFPEKKAKSQDANFIRLAFTPTWWRFTDWTGPQGKEIITSEDSEK